MEETWIKTWGVTLSNGECKSRNSKMYYMTVF